MHRTTGFTKWTIALLAHNYVQQVMAGTVMYYDLSDPVNGQCRLKGIAKDSENFKYYASVSAKDISVNSGCGRCIQVSKEAAQVTAYVLDVCSGCEAGQIKLSKQALTDLSIDQNANNVQIDYKFVNCPEKLLSGNVQACLMEGAGPTYFPVQFYNSKKVISKVQISGKDAQQNKDSFFWFVSPEKSQANWYQNIPISLTSDDDETLTGTLSFSGQTGCTSSTIQFSAASTAEGGGGSSSAKSGSTKDSGNSGVVILAIIGGIVAVIVVVGSIILVRRRQAASSQESQMGDVENQYLSPRNKPSGGNDPIRAPPTNLVVSTGPEPASPAVEYDDASTPVNNPPPAPAQTRQVEQPRQTSFTYSYSKTPAQPSLERESSADSYRSSQQRASSVMSFASSAVPANANRGTVMSTATDDTGYGRESFDIDNIRHTEEMVAAASSSQAGPQHHIAPLSSDSAYASSGVTSPQSYVRATTLKRTNNKSQREAPRVAPPVVPPRSGTMMSDFSDDHGVRDSTSGYSRESLGLLGYPYARKTSSRGPALTGKNQS